MVFFKKFVRRALFDYYHATRDWEWPPANELPKWRERYASRIDRNIDEDFKKALETEGPATEGFSLSVIENEIRVENENSSAKKRRMSEEPAPNYVVIIDEINRGNISKIFGELITLIETSRRVDSSDQLEVTLPYSGDRFVVPPNLYIIGTMNSADRSLTQIDIALRRRFEFTEKIPELHHFKEIIVEGINISKLLENMNERIEALLGRDYMIGHAYFWGLQNDKSMANLAEIMNTNIVPLLQEYFYDDWEKIRLVLGDQFVDKKDHDVQNIFPGATDIPRLLPKYTISEEKFSNPIYYRGLGQKLPTEAREQEGVL